MDREAADWAELTKKPGGEISELPCPKEPWYVKCKGPLIILSIVVIAIVLWWVYLRYTWGENGVPNHDFMNVMVVRVPFLENCCSWWPISHFILFFIIAYIFPECWWQLIVLGVLWECVEVVLSVALEKKRQGARETNGNVEYSNNWWAGSFKDILMNSLGVLSGVLLRKVIDDGRGVKRDVCGRIIS